MFKTASIAVTAFAAMVSTAAPAAASASTGLVEVQFADLDLSRADHQARLSTRIQRAAELTCERPYIRDLKAMAAFESCISGVMSDAERQLAVASIPAELAYTN